LISYLIEVYWDDESLERDPVLFFLYPAFFPQIVSGPIQRSETFSRQMRDVTEHLPSGAQLEAGFSYILGGLMMKLLVGDRLHAFVSAVDAAPGDYGYGVLLATVACYTLQLYADFAGYTNIALGIGMLFGVQGPPNFNAPFAAVDIQEMWRRWHMSLTTWVTDYLFMPLSMALRGLGQTGQMICIVLSMVTIGLWHGLTVNFLVFGLLHAAFVSMTVVVKRGFSARAKDEKRAKTAGAVAYGLSRSAAALAGMILTFSLMSFSQIFWHSATWDKAVTIAEQVLGLTPSGSLGVDNLGVGFVTTIWLSAAVAIYVGSGAPGMKRVATGLDQLAPRWAQQGVWLFLLTTLSTEGGSQFVYGQF